MGWRVKDAFGVDTLQDTFRAPDVKNTNNNGMKATVELLEAIEAAKASAGARHGAKGAAEHIHVRLYM